MSIFQALSGVCVCGSYWKKLLMFILVGVRKTVQVTVPGSHLRLRAMPQGRNQRTAKQRGGSDLFQPRQRLVSVQRDKGLPLTLRPAMLRVGMMSTTFPAKRKKNVQVRHT